MYSCRRSSRGVNCVDISSLSCAHTVAGIQTRGGYGSGGGILPHHGDVRGSERQAFHNPVFVPALHVYRLCIVWPAFLAFICTASRDCEAVGWGHGLVHTAMCSYHGHNCAQHSNADTCIMRELATEDREVVKSRVTIPFKSVAWKDVDDVTEKIYLGRNRTTSQLHLFDCNMIDKNIVQEKSASMLLCRLLVSLALLLYMVVGSTRPGGESDFFACSDHASNHNILLLCHQYISNYPFNFTFIEMPRDSYQGGQGGEWGLTLRNASSLQKSTRIR